MDAVLSGAHDGQVREDPLVAGAGGDRHAAARDVRLSAWTAQLGTAAYTPPRDQRGRRNRVGASVELKAETFPADERNTMNMQQLALLILAGIALTLYIMRRRSRQGKRTPKF